MAFTMHLLYVFIYIKIQLIQLQFIAHIFSEVKTNLYLNRCYCCRSVIYGCVSLMHVLFMGTKENIQRNFSLFSSIFYYSIRFELYACGYKLIKRLVSFYIYI